MWVKMEKTGLFIGAGTLQTQTPRSAHGARVDVPGREKETCGTEKTLTSCPLFCRPSHGDPVHRATDGTGGRACCLYVPGHSQP